MIFDKINELPLNEFRILAFDGSRLLLVGSFDLSYYHDVELSFSEVSFIRCPTFFFAAQFRDADATAEGGRRFEIVTDDETFEIVADAVEMTFGKVYYYDRGNQLQPGERIAPWVRRSDG